MGTVIEVQYKGKDFTIERKIKNEFNRLYKKFSPEKKESIVYKINHRQKNKIKIDTETLYLIKKAKVFSSATGGLFDISIRPVLEAWGFGVSKSNSKIPSKSTLAKFLSFVGSKKIKIVDRYLILPEGLKIDLGGIVKGYGVDRASKIFIINNVQNFLINSGGDLIARGKNPEGKNWKIGIQDPRDSGLIKILSISNKSIATSGDYQRFFIKQGKRYHHIISPFSGKPFRKWISMTVVTRSCLEADILSTAFFGMGLKEIKKFIEKYNKKLKFYAINKNKKIFTNEEV